MAVIDTLLTGQLKVADLTLANVVALQGGALSVSWKKAIRGNRSVLAVQNRYSLGDTSSTAFQSAYACLCLFVGQYAGGAIDPNAQNPGVVIDVTTTGTTVNSGKYPFTNTTNIGLYTYNILYKHLYGNNPSVSFWIDDVTQDTTTPPALKYETDGDITSDITQITWDYPLAVSGYIQISGSPGDV